MSRRGFVAGHDRAPRRRRRSAGSRKRRSAAPEAGQLFYYNWGGVREPQDLPRVHEGDRDQGQEGLLHLERGAVREAQGRRPRLRPRRPDRLHGADPRGREAPRADRLVEASDRRRRRSTRSSASCRSTRRTPTRWRRTGARPGSCTARDLVKERPTTWRQFVNLAKTKYSGKVTVLDGIPECVGSMLVMLGYSYNSDNKRSSTRRRRS